ncbi:Hypothetical protein CINCED_3A024839 [Cinara cedri]|uniref:Uncharacterized protein n=1 Tax=Cinara cedri TaxID=506608 RepID=A0A5E4NNF6_9HEMI|nr:Hypothetical protein CINCED_3A024839 [Cinara cedri]
MSRDYFNLRFVVTPPTLSFTKYNCVKEQGNQFGFLIGERKIKVSNIITDESLNNTITEETICVHSSFPLVDFVDSLCSNPMQIDLKKLKSFLQKCPGNYEKSIIGWYRFRKNSVLTPSISDIRFHTQLSTFFDKISIQSNKFLLCMFNHNFANNLDHNFSHIFYRCENGKSLSPIKVDIVNMSTKPFIEKENVTLEYKTNIDLIQNCKSYKDAKFKVFGEGHNLSPRISVYKFNSVLIEEMDQLIKRIVDNEEEVIRLNTLIAEKKKEIQLKKINKKK